MIKLFYKTLILSFITLIGIGSCFADPPGKGVNDPSGKDTGMNGLNSNSSSSSSDCEKGVKLNTDVPFIGNCLSKEEGGENGIQNAFPRLMGGLSKIVITLILVASLIMLIAGGVMIASSGMNKGGLEQGKKLIMKVVIGIILLGASGMILNIINPNFFKL